MHAWGIISEDIKTTIKKGMKTFVLINPRVSGDFYNDAVKIASKHSRFKDEVDYISSFPAVVANGEYLVSLNDGSCLQIYYEFIKQGKVTYLEKSSLTYLPVAVNDQVQNEYLRFDFSNDAGDSSFFHACAHLHVGFRNTIRLPANETMLFSEFLCLVLYLYYPQEYELFTGKKVTYTRNKKRQGRLTKDDILAVELNECAFLHFFKAAE